MLIIRREKKVVPVVEKRSRKGSMRVYLDLSLRLTVLCNFAAMQMRIIEMIYGINILRNGN